MGHTQTRTKAEIKREKAKRKKAREAKEAKDLRLRRKTEGRNI